MTCGWQLSLLMIQGLQDVNEVHQSRSAVQPTRAAQVTATCFQAHSHNISCVCDLYIAFVRPHHFFSFIPPSESILPSLPRPAFILFSVIIVSSFVFPGILECIDGGG